MSDLDLVVVFLVVVIIFVVVVLIVILVVVLHLLVVVVHVVAIALSNLFTCLMRMLIIFCFIMLQALLLLTSLLSFFDIAVAAVLDHIVSTNHLGRNTSEMFTNTSHVARNTS